MGELVHNGASADDGPVVDISFAGNAHIAYKYAMVTHMAVVSHVHVGHYQGVVSDAGNSLAAGLGAAVDGGALTDGDIVSYLDIGDLALELQVLGLGTDYRSGEHAATRTYLDIRKYGCVGIYLTIVTDFDILVDIGIGPDFDILAEFGLGAYGCQGMNVCHNLL